MASIDPKPARPLDDVMIAMDVVDTLRHDKRLVDRELDDATRRAELIDRLREIYKGQGIDVPDRILEEGVKALAEKRFVYTPPVPSLQVTLARIYVSRGRWGRWAATLAVGAAVLVGGWYFAFERPRSLERAAVEQELAIGVPSRVTQLVQQIEAEARTPTIVAEARLTAESARSAAAARQLKPAREAAARLQATLDELRRAYDIRIVNRQGEITGLWRVPRVNPLGRNYYLVVEAIEAGGRPISREILNEETGQREAVSKWAVRVSKALFDEIQADKLDDGIIQKAVLGSKPKGLLETEWRRDVEGGALTRW